MDLAICKDFCIVSPSYLSIPNHSVILPHQIYTKGNIAS